MMEPAILDEIAAAVGIDYSNAYRAAEKQAWPHDGGRPRKFPLDTLPTDIRTAIATHRAKRDMAHPVCADRGEAQSIAAAKRKMDAAARLRLDRRIELLDAMARWNMAAKLKTVPCARRFEAVYNAGDIPVAPYVQEEFPRVAWASLLRWQKYRAAKDWAAMAGRFRPNPCIIDRAPPLRDFIIGLVTKHPHSSMKFLRDAAVATLGERIDIMMPVTGEVVSRELPSTTAIGRWLNDWKADNKALWARLTNPDQYRNSYMPAPGALYENIRHPNQRWEIDASPNDVMCVDGRYSMYLVVDVYTCRIKVRVTRTPRARAAVLLMRTAILEWGMPQTLGHDQGSDFKAREFQDVLSKAGIVPEMCDAYSPWQKACVERHIGSVQHMFMEQQPGYIGHDVTDRKGIEARRSFAARLGESDEKIFCVSLSAEELQRRLDEWIEVEWNHRPHDGLNGKTPQQMADGYRGTLAKVSGEGAVEYMLMPPADGDPNRTVGKKGIQTNNIFYQHPVLMPGQKVHVRLDPDDLGKIYVFDREEGDFICVAVDPARVGMSRAEMAGKVKAEHRRVLKEKMAEVKAAQKGVNIATISQDIIAAKRKRNGNVVPLPVPQKVEIHSTPALRASQDAADAARGVMPSRPLTQAEQAQHEKVVKLLREPKPAPVQSDEDRFYARARALDAEIEAGRPISDTDAEWLAHAHRAFWYRPRRQQEEMLREFQQERG